MKGCLYKTEQKVIVNIAIVGALTEGENMPNDLQLAFHFLEELSEPDLLPLVYK